MKTKQMAAAAAAVFQFIRSQEEAMLAAGAVMPAAVAAPPPQARSWGLSGRQQQMDLRNLMQIRAFAGARLR